MFTRRLIAAAVAVVAFTAALLVEPAPALAQAEGEYARHFQRGIELLGEKKFDESVEAFKKCIELRPDDSTPYYNVACALSLKGEKEKAIDWFEKALAKGFDDEKHVEQDSDLDPIRGEKRFQKVLAKAFGKAPPEEALVTLKGDVASLDKLKGKVVIVDFWRTWCEPCKVEIPTLVAMEKDLGSKGLVVVGISNEPVPLQEQLADELKINYTLLRQQGALPAPFENVRAFPTKFILDKDGKVVKKLIGQRDRAELEAIVLPLLGGEGPKEGGEKEPEPEPKKGEPQAF